jgi:hypothetical protein
MLPYVASVVSGRYEASVEPEACAVSVETGTTVNATDASGHEADAVKLLAVIARVPFRSTLIELFVQLTL